MTGYDPERPGQIWGIATGNWQLDHWSWVLGKIDSQLRCCSQQGPKPDSRVSVGACWTDIKRAQLARSSLLSPSQDEILLLTLCQLFMHGQHKGYYISRSGTVRSRDRRGCFIYRPVLFAVPAIEVDSVMKKASNKRE